MGEYRVYRAGEAEHVRVAATGAAGAGRGAGRREGARRSATPRRRWLWLMIIAAAVAAVLYWIYGREAVGNSKAAVEIAKLSDQVPSWVFVAAPVVAGAAILLVAVYVAFGRHLALKLVLVAGLVAVVATPGFAVGYANGIVGGTGDGSSKGPDVDEAEKVLAKNPLPNKPMNILLIGSDKNEALGDPGRSDTQMLVRLDPETKSISMFSVPRDLRVYIEGVGYDKINAAYFHGGDKGAITAFRDLTGLPVNHFIEVNFGGFWHVVNILGGVYLPVDHSYFVPASADYKSINLQAGYQLVHGKQALNFVRFRKDQQGDFTRMQRQQLFLKELQRQSGRWSGDWAKVIRMIKAIISESTSDLDSLKELKPLVALAFEVDTSKVYQVHLEGSTPMYDGVSYVEASEAEVAAAVNEFTHPTQAPIKTSGLKVSKKMFTVHVHNGSGIDGLATTTVDQLTDLGYQAEALGDAPELPGKVTVVYASKSLETQAELIGEMMYPSDVRIVERAPGSLDGITVFVASSFDGTIEVPEDQQEAPVQTLEKNVRSSWSTWQETDRQTPLRLEAPTAWSSSFIYDEFRTYKIETTEGKHVAAAVAVVQASGLGYWSIQAMRWLDPPAIENPNSTEVVGGTKYMLFYQGHSLHMVAWKRQGTLYWVLNTLGNELSNDVMMGLATSCKPVR